MMEGDTRLIPAYRMCGLWVGPVGWKFQAVHAHDSKRFDHQVLTLDILGGRAGPLPKKLYMRFPRTGYYFVINKHTKQKGNRVVVYGQVYKEGSRDVRDDSDSWVRQTFQVPESLMSG